MQNSIFIVCLYMFVCVRVGALVIVANVCVFMCMCVVHYSMFVCKQA